MACYKPHSASRAAIFFFELGSQTKSSPKRKDCEVLFVSQSVIVAEPGVPGYSYKLSGKRIEAVIFGE